MEKYLNTVRWIVSVLSLPILILSSLYVWHHIIIGGGYTVSSGQSIDSLIRVLSHIDGKHFQANALSVFSICTIIGIFRHHWYVGIQIAVLTVISVLWYAVVFTSAIGFSQVIMGMFGVSVVVYLQFIRDSVQNEEVNSRGGWMLLMYVYIGALLLLFGTTLMFDISVLAGLVTIDNPELFSLVIESNRYYTEISSLIHLSGFMCGLIVGSVYRVIESNVSTSSKRRI